jgi:MarR family transcriptional repressor of emrRAB
MVLPPARSNGPLQQRIADIESALARASAHLPTLAATEVLIIRAVALLAREFAALFEDELRPHGLNETDFRTLMMLFSQPEHTAHPSELCSYVGQSPANMTRVTDGLFERGLISRVASDEDRRRMILRITPAGEVLVHALLPGTHARLREIFGDVPAGEREHLLGQLRDILGRMDACAARDATQAAGTATHRPEQNA